MASGCHEKAKSLTWCSNLTFCFSSAEKILLIYMVSQVIFFTPKYDFFLFSSFNKTDAMSCIAANKEFTNAVRFIPC